MRSTAGACETGGMEHTASPPEAFATELSFVVSPLFNR